MLRAGQVGSEFEIDDLGRCGTISWWKNKQQAKYDDESKYGLVWHGFPPLWDGWVSR
jgi:hypothetical protein